MKIHSLCKVLVLTSKHRRFQIGANKGRTGPGLWLGLNILHFQLQPYIERFTVSIIYCFLTALGTTSVAMKREKDITVLFAPVSKEQLREREDEDREGAWEQDEREAVELAGEDAEILRVRKTQAVRESEEQKEGQPVDHPSCAPCIVPSGL